MICIDWPDCQQPARFSQAECGCFCPNHYQCEGESYPDPNNACQCV
jgi:hypothetical protein